MGGRAVAGPSGYVYAVKGLVEELAQGGEGGEEEGVGAAYGEVEGWCVAKLED